MQRSLASVFSILLLALSLACSKSDQQSANQKAAEARQKTRREAEKLKQEVRQDARALDQKVHQAVQGQPVQTGSAGEAEEKLRRGGRDLQAAGGQAAVKLDRAAIVARVKTRLVSDVGLSTVTGIDVDATGQVVTLAERFLLPSKSGRPSKRLFR